MSTVTDFDYKTKTRYNSNPQINHTAMILFEVMSSELRSDTVINNIGWHHSITEKHSTATPIPFEKIRNDITSNHLLSFASNNSTESLESDLIPAKIFLEDILARAAYNELKATRNLLDGIEKRFSQNRLREVNYICEHIDFSLIGKYAAIGLVKSTNRCKAQIPKWELMFKNAQNHLTSSGIDPSIVFSNI